MFVGRTKLGEEGVRGSLILIEEVEEWVRSGIEGRRGGIDVEDSEREMDKDGRWEDVVGGGEEFEERSN